jgi:hypothetical protein
MAISTTSTKLPPWEALRLRAAQAAARRGTLLTVQLVLDPRGDLVGFVLEEPVRVECWSEENPPHPKPN